MRSSSEHATSRNSSDTPRPRFRRSLERWADTRWGGSATAFVVLLAIGASLRAVGIPYGLPFGNVLNPDEQSIVPRAWKLVHGGGGDPHWFDYPTLLMYVNAPFQAWQHHPSFLTARVIAVVIGLASIAATWLLARRAYGDSAGGVAAAITAVCTLHVAYSREAVTDVPLTLGVAVALALMVAGRIELAGVAAGLATGFKYPGVFLVVPLVVCAWRRWQRLAVALVGMVLAFLASSPFVLVHRRQAWHEAFRVQRLARKGWLGFEHDHSAPVAFAGHLWHAFGPVVLISLVALAVALWRRTRNDLVLVSFVVVYFADLMTLRAHFDRYTLPLVPPLAALAGRFRALVPVALLLLVVPLTWTIRDDKRLIRTDTRVVAARWAEHHIPRGTSIAEDPSAPVLPGYRVLSLQLPGPGRTFDPNRNVARLRLRGIRDVMITGAVTDRVRAARADYPREAAFYNQLARTARRVYFIGPGNGRAGPWVAIYAL